jgi:hypothetical protein
MLCAYKYALLFIQFIEYYKNLVDPVNECSEVVSPINNFFHSVSIHKSVQP